MKMSRAHFTTMAHNFFRVIQAYKGIGRPRVSYALVVIFLEFFAWGLLTTPTIEALKNTFPGRTLMMNGIVLGIKGLLSFVMSPPIGFFSDVFGRKPFLLLTVLFTCLPIPVMFVSSWWFFIMIAISGLFSVTFSVVFAYVADLTAGQKRSSAYGQVSATFAASLIISPALGAHLSTVYESLPEKLRLPQVSLWEQAAPLSTIRKIGLDYMIWTLCLTVFLSYLPEAGQYSCFFLYLNVRVKFTQEEVAMFIAVIGLLSVLAQTVLMSRLIDKYNGKATILIGLVLQAVQLILLGFFKNSRMMWISGIIASLSSITYPALSAYISAYADADKQGLVQGLITGVRSLCGGIGPAMFGMLFYLFDTDMYNEMRNKPYSPNTAQDPAKPFIDPTTTFEQNSPRNPLPTNNGTSTYNEANYSLTSPSWVVGPPFLVGAVLVLLAAITATFIPDTIMSYRRSTTKSPANYYRYNPVSNGHFENGIVTVTDGSSISTHTHNLSNSELLQDTDD